MGKFRLLNSPLLLWKIARINEDEIGMTIKFTIHPSLDMIN